jgi:hypothetical protein
MFSYKTSTTSRLLAMAGLGSAFFLASGAQANMPANALLKFNDATIGCLAGGTPPSGCNFDLQLIDVAYFTMDLNSNNVGDETERTALYPGPDQGIRLGTVQTATGSHGGAPNGSESPGIDDPWGFGGNTGMHLTTVAPTILSDDGAGNVTIGMSGWTVAWNGIAVIPMGTGAYAHVGNPNGVGVITCAADCAAGDTFVLNYSATVPAGDPSGFGNVKYGLHLEGTIEVPASLDVSVGALADGTFGGTAANDYRVTRTDLEALSVIMDSEYDRRSDIFDFSVTGVGAGNPVDIVLTLTSAIADSDAVYRKYTPATGWISFTSTGGNFIKSAASVGGVCPAAGDVAYIDGLNVGDDCVQLTIVDGGAFDADADATNGTIVDPGFVGVATSGTDAIAATTGTSGCTLTTRPATGIAGEWLLIGGLLAGLGLYRRKRLS